MTTPLTAQSSIADWLAHPVGGDLVRGLLAQSGANADSLAPIVGLPLQQLVVLSQGQMPQSVVDDLVRAANGGEMPEETGPTGWVEKVTGGRFSGQTVNLSSEAGLRGNASGNAYTVSKHGVIGLTKSRPSSTGPQASA